MSLVRALVRRRVRDLTLITAAVSSIQADLLIAGGCVARVVSPYIAMEELGLAPNFRRAAEKGEVEVVEIGEAFLAFGLKAGAAGAPFAVLPLPIAASACARVNPLYKLSKDPFTGSDVVCVPALRPEFALLHAHRADAAGTLQYSSSAYMDPLLARAADHVLATAEEMVEAGALDRSRSSIPGILVHGIAVSRGGARPTACLGDYEVDRRELSRYSRASKSTESLAAYLNELGGTEAEYLASLPPVPPAPPSGASPTREGQASVAEIMATVISHSVRDGMFTGAGTGCWEVAAGLRLAQLTHAPNLSYTFGGSGAVDPKLDCLPPSLNGDEALAGCSGVTSLEDIFDFELRGRFDVMFASAMQVDQFGNLNLACIGAQSRPNLRGPGTVGLEFAPLAPELIIFLRSHSKHSLVDRVDFISGMGYGLGPGSRAQWGIDDRHGPRLVITNLAVMDFHPASRRMRLKSVHPGVTVEQVKAATGFELLLPDRLETTPLPTDEELRLLRTRIDRGGLLAGLVA